jgi:hypothetical protein
VANKIETEELSYQEALKSFIEIVNDEIDTLDSQNLKKMKSGQYALCILFTEDMFCALEENKDVFIDYLYEENGYVVRFGFNEDIYIYRA